MNWTSLNINVSYLVPTRKLVFLVVANTFPFLVSPSCLASGKGLWELWNMGNESEDGGWTLDQVIGYRLHTQIYLWQKPKVIHLEARFRSQLWLIIAQLWDSLLSRYSEITSDQIEKENLPQKLTRPMMTDRLQVRYFSLSCIGLYCHIVILLPHSVSHFFRCLAHRLCLPVALNQRLRPLSPFCYSLLNYHQ